MNEFKFIDELVKTLEIKDKDVLVGFGDDCAVVNCGSKKLLFTNDILVENIHFIKSKVSGRDLGWKLVSVNVSDVVSSGGFPRWANISIAISKEDIEYIKDIYLGIKEALDFYKFSIIGGNTSSSEKLIVDFFLVGETDRYITRDNAKAGEKVFISDYLGLSRAGLELLLMNKDKYEDFELKLIKYHNRPVARIDLVNLLKESASSCIDISDGLAGDLGHISRLSKKRIVIEENKLPIHPLLKMFCEKYNKKPIDYILYGGEDYQLAFTSSKDIENCFEIGYIEEGQGVYLKTECGITKLKDIGFSHI